MLGVASSQFSFPVQRLPVPVRPAYPSTSTHPTQPTTHSNPSVLNCTLEPIGNSLGYLRPANKLLITVCFFSTCLLSLCRLRVVRSDTSFWLVSRWGVKKFILLTGFFHGYMYAIQGPDSEAKTVSNFVLFICKVNFFVTMILSVGIQDPLCSLQYRL